MKKAFGYLRVSGKGQVEGDGFTRQRVAIEKYAAANGIKIVKFFEEKGVSGTTEAEDRPAWMEMIQAIMSNGVKTIVVERLDRVARKLMTQEAIVGDCQQRQIELLSTEEPDLLNDDPTRVMLRQFLGAIAQYEKSMIVLKLRGARKRVKAATGRCEGRKPYSNVEVIDKIKRMHSAGMTQTAIARQLNAEGIKTQDGKDWLNVQVGRVLARNVVVHNLDALTKIYA